VRAVVRGAVDRRLGRDQAHRLAGQLLARRIQERDVVEAGVAAGAPRIRALVQDDDLLVVGAQRGDAVLRRSTRSPSAGS
jgi:hypothetical protein